MLFVGLLLKKECLADLVPLLVCFKVIPNRFPDECMETGSSKCKRDDTKCVHNRIGCVIFVHDREGIPYLQLYKLVNVLIIPCHTLASASNRNNLCFFFFIC